MQSDSFSKTVMALVFILVPLTFFSSAEAGSWWHKDTKDITVSMNWTGSKSLHFVNGYSDKMSLKLSGGFQFSGSYEFWRHIHVGLKINSYASSSNDNDQVAGSISRTYISLPICLKTDWMLILDDKFACRGVGGIDLNPFGSGISHSEQDARVSDGRLWEFPCSIGLEVRPRAFPIHVSLTYTRVIFTSGSSDNVEQYGFQSGGNNYLFFGLGVSVSR